MKTINYKVYIFTLILLFGCNPKNDKINQLAAEFTAKQFISQNTIHSDARNWGESGTFGLEGITNISPISQFSETDASLVISFDYKVTPEFEFLQLKFNYKKDVNNNWMLNSVEEVQGVYSETGIYSKRLQTILNNSTNLAIIVGNSEAISVNKQVNENDEYQKFLGLWCGEGFGCWRISQNENKFTIEWGSGDSNGNFYPENIYSGSYENGKIKMGNSYINYFKKDGDEFISAGEYEEIFGKFIKN